MGLRNLFLMALASLGLAACNEHSVIVTLSNPTAELRIDEPVSLHRDSLEVLLGALSDEEVILVSDSTGFPQPSQCDDLTGDGRWDELFFVCDLHPNQMVSLTLSKVDKKKIPYFEPRSHAQLKYSATRNNVFEPVTEHTRPADHVAQSNPFLYQFEGPGWENDLVAFRSYFDSRNSKDIFGKLTPSMVLDSVGLPGTDYHTLAPWGMDILKVGPTLGAGSLAMRVNDSLYRLGPTREAHFRLLANGPVRSIIELTYTGWQVAQEGYDVKEVITIRPGTWFYENEVTLLNDYNDTRELVTGITLFHRLDSALAPRFVALNKQYNGLIAEGGQTENKDWLSMGILVDQSACNNWFMAPETAPNNGITLTACVALSAKAKQPVRYLFFAGWEQSDPRFKTEGLIQQVMENEARRLANPIALKLQRN